jgi:hypothetical protein
MCATCRYFPLPLISINHLHWLMQEWDETSQQANCFDEIFKPQDELINILQESQLRTEILVDIELNSPNITNTISFPRPTTIVCITLHSSTISANITLMNAFECNAYVICLHTSKGMKPHRTPPRTTYDAKLYRYGRTIGHDKTSDATESCNAYDMLHLSIYFTSFTYNTNLKQYFIFLQIQYKPQIVLYLPSDTIQTSKKYFIFLQIRELISWVILEP